MDCLIFYFTISNLHFLKFNRMVILKSKTLQAQKMCFTESEMLLPCSRLAFHLFCPKCRRNSSRSEVLKSCLDKGAPFVHC
jgi:hypothetical protein